VGNSFILFTDIRAPLITSMHEGEHGRNGEGASNSLILPKFSHPGKLGVDVPPSCGGVAQSGTHQNGGVKWAS
jgi:hypothetical protein